MGAYWDKKNDKLTMPLRRDAMEQDQEILNGLKTAMEAELTGFNF